ncbi:exodeoxyribonuclease VII small subunit [Irregularibacter muris]|uniref:Exodeoxyribonuclease 7 small subunit n=1 Tax=Irregularibacter muris TaxID=1796619 RepID=A0AAE3HCV8_9FIRM|nr:exodeoxyribonuclease VII small subunit [Irregularibacter muris]MCR1898000.1 exodeoxyribonuclease VII small subunit [Irregularibacter muris]
MKDSEKTFEQGVERLEEIVSILEDGKISLERAVEIFEEGIQLTKYCNRKLESIENKISLLIEEDGSVQEKKFDLFGEEGKNDI